MIKKILPIILVLFLIIVFIFIPRKQVFEFIALGSVPFKITIQNRSYYNFKTDKQKIINLVNTLENIYSSHLDGSELSNVNNKAGSDYVDISNLLKNVVERAIQISNETNGAFDITVKPLIKLWKIASMNNKIPSDDEIKTIRSIVGINLIEINNNKIKFDKKGVMLDLGGIAKGTIVDRLVDLLQSNGITSAVVNAGGDIRVFGKESYLIGIASPNGNDDIVATLRCKNSAVVTSGNYQRYSIIDGKKFSHIINPKTGVPLKDINTSFTVIADDAETADAFATAFMVLQNTVSKSIIKKSNDVLGAVIVHRNEDVITIESVIDNTNCELSGN